MPTERPRPSAPHRGREGTQVTKKPTPKRPRTAATRKAPAYALTHSPWSVVVAACTGAAAVFFLLGYCGVLPILVAPALAGVFVALLSGDAVSAGTAGAVGGTVGGVAAAIGYSNGAINASFAAAPAYANPDVLSRQLYGGIVTSLLQGNPITSGSPGGGATVLVVGLLTALIAAGSAYGLNALGSRRELGQQIAGWIAVVALALVFLATGWNNASDFRDSLATPVPAGTYAYDAFIYQGAYQAMLHGKSYYQGFLEAASGDSRLIEAHDVRNGKFYGFVSSPTLMREPWSFYLWRVVAPGGSQGVFLTALIAAAGVLLVTHWGLQPISRAASLLGPVLVYPILLLSCSWMNIFFPDLWAGLAMLASLALLARRNLPAALGFALAAALFRETLIFWLLALLVYAILRARSAPSGKRDAVFALSAVGIFAALYAVHYVQASQLIAPDINGGTGGFVDRLLISSKASLEGKFLAPTSYMMWPYGFFRLPGAALAVLGVFGFSTLHRRNRAFTWMAAGYGAFWLVYYATVGAASSYWGQQVMPFYLLGVAFLVAALGKLDRKAADAPVAPPQRR